MHILYFHQHFSTPQGMAGIRSYEMARRLIARGHKVTMVCGSYQGAHTGLEGEPINGVRRGWVDDIEIIEFVLPYSNYDSLLKRSTVFLRFALRSIQVAVKKEYDLVFATSTPLTAGIPGICMKFVRWKRPFIFEVRDLWPELPREMGVISNPIVLGAMGVLEWLSYHMANGCIGLSPGILKGIQKRGIKKEVTRMIPNGCDFSLFKPTKEKKVVLPGISEGDFVGIFTGTHGVANGLDAVLNVAKVLKSRKHDHIKLVFMGDGRLKPELIERSKNEGLTNCLFFDPIKKTELAKLVAKVDVGLMILANCEAFYYGTSPNKFFDYIASGVPVINNYPGWLADMIKEYQCGIAVPPEDPDAFADALIYLSEHPDECIVQGERARKLAEEKFDRETLGDQFVDFIEEIYEKTSRHHRG